ncbi:unnamed protein product, partial [marine sediment metagenome]
MSESRRLREERREELRSVRGVEPKKASSKKKDKKPEKIEDLHQMIEDLKAETSETLVKVQTSVDVGEKTKQADSGSVYATSEYREYVQSEGRIL